jgi:hypothetical protein
MPMHHNSAPRHIDVGTDTGTSLSVTGHSEDPVAYLETWKLRALVAPILDLIDYVANGIPSLRPLRWPAPPNVALLCSGDGHIRHIGLSGPMPPTGRHAVDTDEKTGTMTHRRSLLRGQEVNVRLDRTDLGTGLVDDMTDNGDIVWVIFGGPIPRRMFLAEDPAEFTVLPAASDR